MRSPVVVPLVLGLAFPATASAQGSDPAEAELRELRLEHLDAREAEGWVLMGWGAANVLGGGLVAGLGHDDEVLLSAGLTSTGWGLVNCLLSLLLLDLSGDRREEILDGRHGDVTDPVEVRERAMADQLRSGQIFALNLGLDVFYLGSGLLLYLLGREKDEDWLSAAGLTVVGQGVFLFGFDLVNWIGANGRASELADL